MQCDLDLVGFTDLVIPVALAGWEMPASSQPAASSQQQPAASHQPAASSQQRATICKMPVVCQVGDVLHRAQFGHHLDFIGVGNKILTTLDFEVRDAQNRLLNLRRGAL